MSIFVGARQDPASTGMPKRGQVPRLRRLSQGRILSGENSAEPTSPRPGKRVCRFAGGAHLLCHHNIFIVIGSRRPLSGVVTGKRLDPVRWRKQMPKSICIATLVTMMAIAPAYSAAPQGMHRRSHEANGCNDRQNDRCREEEGGNDGSRHVKSRHEKRQYGGLYEVHGAEHIQPWDFNEGRGMRGPEIRNDKMLTLLLRHTPTTLAPCGLLCITSTYSGPRP